MKRPDASGGLGQIGLAVHDYAHTTAPNRRYPDLGTQRILKAAIAGAPPSYSVDALEEIVARCNDRAMAARKIERLMFKIVAATFLSGRIGETFDALVTGVSPNGTYVRVNNPPVEGRVVRGGIWAMSARKFGSAWPELFRNADLLISRAN